MGNGTEGGEPSRHEDMSLQEEEGDNWVVECSDDESYNPAALPGPAWEPRPEVAKLLYERLSRGEPFTLEWLCPGRRSPSPECSEDDEADLEEPEETKQEERTLPSGFDFDEDLDAPGMKPAGFTPRRTPVSGQIPRVACMDKIIDDIRRHKKIEAAERKATPGRRLYGSTGRPRKLSALGGHRRLLGLGSDRKGHGAVSSGSCGGIVDKSFTFEDDFGADVKIPAGGGGGAGFAPAGSTAIGPAEVKTEIKLTLPTAAPPKEQTSTSSGVNAPSVTKTEVGEFATVPTSVPTGGTQISTLHSQPTSVADASTPSSKSSPSLSSQMGGLTCKPNNEIKKEPLGDGEMLGSAVLPSGPATPISTPTAQPPPQPLLPVEVKTEPGIDSAPPANIPATSCAPQTQTPPTTAPSHTDTAPPPSGEGTKLEPGDVTTGTALTSQVEKTGVDNAVTATSAAETPTAKSQI